MRTFKDKQAYEDNLIKNQKVGLLIICSDEHDVFKLKFKNIYLLLLTVTI